MTMMVTAEYYTVEEFAVLMNMSGLTIRRAIREGRISAIRIGSSKKAAYRIPRTQIDKLLVLTEQELKKDKDKEIGNE